MSLIIDAAYRFWISVMVTEITNFLNGVPFFRVRNASFEKLANFDPM